MDNRKRAVWGGIAIVLGCSAVIAVSVFLLWPLTDMIAEHDVQGVAEADRAKELRLARDAARGRIIQVVLGLLAVGGFVYTARNFTLARQQSELNRRTLELATLQAREQTETTRRTLEQSESAQMTDRFMRAIDQLGSDAVDIRLGGIHSLERIAQDSARDHPAVMEALAAFVRRASQACSGEPPQDLQAAVTVLVRRKADADRGPVKLSGARLDRLDLADANLAGADLTGVTLTGADLRRADLAGADLAGADLGGARLGGARLDGAKLARASLRTADLTDAGLPHAELVDADLGGARLRRARCAQAVARGACLAAADLSGADLTGADLSGADLSGAVMEDADLTGAVLARAALPGARADGAVMSGAVLSDAVASDASLCRADLTGCRLTDANLSGARLAGARLDGVDLTVVKLVGLDLTGALASDGARLPSGWRREADGRLIRRLS
ncbi:pentapeptide repeat-containing protein [Nonomuraea harbinensis]|uniref:Pentapeptide repeat-containing protein n=1 Tax=Nonomuraea harbinensis TaxID=1286938 RepID=A0ABW1C3S6_9ACTN|nr:pentapeptide repeat-containing protein [Nonomuraea harbinensis]